MPCILQPFQIRRTLFTIAIQHIGYCILNSLFSTKTFSIKLFKNIAVPEEGFRNVTGESLA